MHALAMDVREGPLARAREHIGRYGLNGRIETRLSDGVAALKPGEADTVIAAGMGGELILRILRDAPWVRDPAKRLILQPMTMAPLLRRGLLADGFDILEERAVDDGKKIYTVLLAAYTGEVQTPSPLFAQMGRIPPQSPGSASYAQRVLRDLQNRARGITHGGGDASALFTLMAEIEAVYLKGDKS